MSHLSKFKNLEKPDTKVIGLNDSNPPEDPFVGKVLSKIHARLRDKAELVKLHLKHYHMKPKNFQRRTSALKCPKDIYDLYEEVVGECPACQKHVVVVCQHPRLDQCPCPWSQRERGGMRGTMSRDL